MEKLKVKDLIPGDVYYQGVKGDSKLKFISRFKGVRSSLAAIPFLEDISYLNIELKEFRTSSNYIGSSYSDFSILRKATYTEVKWLQKCEEVGKYVEKPAVCGGHHVKRVAPIPFKHTTKRKEYYNPNIKLKF